eukprot:ANDGO_04985.mRNA.1 Tyrosine aminotransferase
MSDSNWHIKASIVSHRTSNPIRKVVDQLKLPPNPEKQMIPLSIGDPTVFGNLPACRELLNAMHDAIDAGKWNGYAHSCGYSDARKAVALRYQNMLNRHHTNSHPRFKVFEEDVVLGSGCSGALDMVISVLANEGDNILLPRPGFSLYKTLCDSKGIETRFYSLKPEAEWEANLEEMRNLIDANTRGILVNNPSNPCGSVYNLHHLKAILEIAREHRLPIIADEIYADMVFSKSEFFPMAALTDKVPVLHVGGLAKQYLVPGWRLGWVIVSDPVGALEDVRRGLLALSTVILGPNTLVQGAIPQIFETVPESYYTELNKTLEGHAEYSVERFRKIPGLRVVVPRGAMYLMVGIDTEYFADIADDVDFSRKLITEESVMVLPGQCFGITNFFRVVICPPIDKLEEAYDRIEQFCDRHRRDFD